MHTFAAVKVLHVWQRGEERDGQRLGEWRYLENERAPADVAILKVASFHCVVAYDLRGSERVPDLTR